MRAFVEQLLVAVRQTSVHFLEALVGPPGLVDWHHQAVHLIHGLVELSLFEEGCSLFHESNQTLFREELSSADSLFLLREIYWNPSN